LEDGKKCIIHICNHTIQHILYWYLLKLFMKRTFSWFGILAIIIIIVAFCWTQRTHAPVVDDVAPSNTLVPPSSQLSPETTETASSMIEVTAPLPNSTLTSPMTLMGRARGPWYFEASFPIELRDANNVLITTVVAQAQ
jgi:hypothetical protein